MKRIGFTNAVVATFFAALRTPAAFAAHKEHHMSTLADLQHPEALHKRTHALDLFHIDQLIRFRTPLDPEKIETFEDTERKHVTDAKEIAEFYGGLERAKPVAARGGAEYRWKAVAYDASGERIAEIYASAISHNGRVGKSTYFNFSNDEFAHAFRKLAGIVEPALK
jgi:hypothetical protein